MIQMQVWIEDFSLDNSIELTLPDDNLSSKIDLSNDIIISEYGSDTSFGVYDLEKLNEILQEINDQNPDLDLELLEELFKLYDCESISDKNFLNLIIDGDFLNDSITDFIVEKCGDYDECYSQQEALAAMYLCVCKKIPFSRNIPLNKIDEVFNDLIDFIDWNYIWGIYEYIGFKVVEINGETSVLYI